MDKNLKNKDISVHFYSTNQVDLSTATAVFTFENDSTKKYYIADITTKDFIKRFILIVSIGETEGENIVLDNEILTIMLDGFIVQIDINNNQMAKCKETDSFGSAFTMKKYKNDFIVHYECAIVRYDENLNEIWSFGGADIFANVNGKVTFVMAKDRIKLYDFEDNYYEIDYDGKII